ncbi:MAG: bifunctional alpha/beta hydrolase/OsmC family protein [Nocardioides sp.]
MNTARDGGRHPRRRQVTFRGSTGTELAGTLDLPDGPPVATALFAHCFTCDRTSRAASRVGRTLAGAGYAVLRFDFTGLGESDGSFAETTFTTNLEDLLAAVRWLGTELQPPRLLVGHSLGGAAVLAIAGELDSVDAVAVIGAPSTPAHVTRLLDDAEPEPDGHLRVTIGGRKLHVSADLARDLSAQPQLDRIATLGKPLLVLHAPADAVVGIGEARTLFETARHPKSFVSLDQADHLLLRGEDADFAGAMIATWSGRYVRGDDAHRTTTRSVPGAVVVDELDGTDGYAHLATSGRHTWSVDEPPDVGGADTGPGPYDVLLSALGACTSMTMRMYARRKGWEYGASRVTLRHGRVHASDCETCETTTGHVDRVERHIDLDPTIPQEQRTALLAIADRCPVHRTLLGEVAVLTTHEAPGS